MRFYKVKIILIAAFLVAGFLGTPAKADNANPPKILDLIQVTQGPYKPGDLVTYKIVFSGGNPGLKYGDISFTRMDRYYFQEPNGVNDIQGNGLISFSLPIIDPGTYGPMTARIRDKTDLESVWMNASSPYIGPLSFIVSDYIFKPIKGGEIIPSSLLTHTLDLQMIPKNPKTGGLFDLPKYSSVAAPIYYSVSGDSSSICKMIRDYEYPILPGGQLQILNNGLCKLSVSADVGRRASYSQPEIISLVQSVKSDSAQILSFQVGIKKITSSIKTLTCVKGKLTKKVTGTTPKCPAGYKKA
jgi:hypothetical protein